MPTIEDEVRTVFEAYASRDVPTVERRAAVQRRIDRRRRRRLTAGLIAVVLVIAGAAAIATAGNGGKRAATVPTTPTVVITPTLTGPVTCDGSGADSVLRALFASLSSGKRTALATYFTEPREFSLWWDPSLPSGQVIDFTAGPGSNTYTLDALQSHLDSLAAGGLRISLTGFTSAGYEDHDYHGSLPGGGGFSFVISARLNGSAKYVAGDGTGMIDCVTGKLKAVVIDGW